MRKKTVGIDILMTFRFRYAFTKVIPIIHIGLNLATFP